MNEYPPQLPAAPKTSGMAIASLVLGVLSFLMCSIFTGIPAIICGHVARKRIRNSGGTLTGDGLGLAGLIVGYVNLGFSLLFIPLLVAIAVPNFVKARDMAQRNNCIMNLRQIDGAKEQWALEKNQQEGAQPTAADLDVYLHGGFSALKCPAKGTYTIGPVGKLPTCSVSGHELPE